MLTPALFSGWVDIYWEYMGMGLMNVMGHDKVIAGSRSRCFVSLPNASANNTFEIFPLEKASRRKYLDKSFSVAAFLNQ
jgi:osmoprotectant transport system substrate-binding protein